MERSPPSSNLEIRGQRTMLKLKELFDNPYPFEEFYSHGVSAKYRFITEDGSMINVDFFELGSELVKDSLDGDLPTDENYQYVAFAFQRGYKYDITGTGDQYRIFSTVGTILKDYLMQRKVKELVLYFSAKESSRIKLYRILSEKIKRELRASRVVESMDIEGNIVFLIIWD